MGNRADFALYRQAIKNGWPIPKATRERIKEQIMESLSNSGASKAEYTSASNTLLLMVSDGHEATAEETADLEALRSRVQTLDDFRTVAKRGPWRPRKQPQARGIQR